MAALSFLYCLKSREAPGSEEILSELRPMFLSELERGLEMARGHYEMQLAEVAAEAAESGEVSVILSGQRLPQMGREEMRDVVSAALNTIDLMEMSLPRFFKVCIEYILQPQRFLQMIFSEKGTKMISQLHVSKFEILSFSNKIHKNNDILSLM